MPRTIPATAFFINDCTYSTLASRGSDNNGPNRAGYSFQNVSGISVNGCGAEQNINGAFQATSDGTAGTVTGVRGLVLTGCFSYSNGTAAGFPSLINCVSTVTGQHIKVTLIGCTDKTSGGISVTSNNTGTTVLTIGCDLSGTTNAVNGGVITNLA